LSGHPVDRYADLLRQAGAIRIGEVATAPIAATSDNGWVGGKPRPLEADANLGGIVASVRPLKTRKGDRMAVFGLEDAQGSLEVVVFPEAFQRAASVIEVGRLVFVRGKVERDEETARVIATEVAPLDTLRERVAREVAIHLRTPTDRGTFEALGEIFSRH